MKAWKILIGILALSVTPLWAQTSSTDVLVVDTFPATSPDLQTRIDLLAFSQRLNKYFSEQSGATRVVKTASPMPSTVAWSYMASGRVSMMWTLSSYFTDKDMRLLLLGQPPFITAEDFLRWRNSPATSAIAETVYAKLGVKSIPCSIVDSNMDFALRRLPGEDYRFTGAKVAMTGVYRDIYAAMGVSPMALPFGEFRSLLEKGLIDGAHTWTPHESIALTLYDSIKVLYWPSQARRFFAVDLYVSQKFWNELTTQDQSAIETICRQLVEETLVSSKKYAADAVEKFRKASIPVMPLPDKEVDAMRGAWYQIASKRSAFDPAFETLFNSLYRRQP